MADLQPTNYAATLAAAKRAIQAARTRAVLAANGEMIGLYWDLGQLILQRQSDEGWGAKVIERLSNDLRSEFPGMTGLSRGNLGYMRRLAGAWRDRESCLRLVGRIPWGHIQTLLDREGQSCHLQTGACSTVPKRLASASIPKSDFRRIRAPLHVFPQATRRCCRHWRSLPPKLP